MEKQTSTSNWLKRATPIGMTEAKGKSSVNRLEEMREQVTAYHKKHPEVWTMFEDFAFQMIERGYKNYSVNAIFERIRWEKDAGGDGITQFKIGNNYRAFYARRFMRKYPEHEGFFRTREQTSEHRDATNMSELGPKDFRDTA